MTINFKDFTIDNCYNSDREVYTIHVSRQEQHLFTAIGAKPVATANEVLEFLLNPEAKHYVVWIIYHYDEFVRPYGIITDNKDYLNNGHRNRRSKYPFMNGIDFPF